MNEKKQLNKLLKPFGVRIEDGKIKNKMKIQIKGTTYKVLARTGLKNVSAVAILIVKRPTGKREYNVLEFTNGSYQII